MNCAVFSCCEVDHAIFNAIFSDREVDGQTAGVNKRHATLIVSLDASKHILLIGVGLSLQLHKLGELESLLHAPLDDAAVTRHGHKRLTLGVTVHPLDLPDNVRVLTLQILALC